MKNDPDKLTDSILDGRIQRHSSSQEKPCSSCQESQRGQPQEFRSNGLPGIADGSILRRTRQTLGANNNRSSDEVAGNTARDGSTRRKKDLRTFSPDETRSIGSLLARFPRLSPKGEIPESTSFDISLNIYAEQVGVHTHAPCVVAGHGVFNCDTLNVYGTDLGFAANFKGKTYFIFGDTWVKGRNDLVDKTSDFGDHPVSTLEIYPYNNDMMASVSSNI